MCLMMFYGKYTYDQWGYKATNMTGGPTLQGCQLPCLDFPNAKSTMTGGLLAMYRFILFGSLNRIQVSF